ncbi:pyrroloquinoline quinone biosynthesis protein PqqF [Pseudomonas sp.]|uniref:pyrroloquinoline quinone biosynthesis protein PqqF n=1 Tax=Pseudomonas sp. TaxID=306 RepID=UPI0028AA6CD8|nr:pyrroloquinoline quinone biosynthesis protein PqqF [Pseudomonas sp.]
MPTTDPTRRPARSTLANGLQVRLLPLPGAAQSAAWVRVHAGAHDAPSAYPGLAHFLEHLLFLGSHAYPGSDALMPFVQACGGQLNASTRERHTDFFFQVPADQLDGALLRLLDMLARPLLDRQAQLREREVLQAEFQARAKDVDTLCDAALGQGLAAAHPFAAFHAGNRDTLPVEDDAFQAALRGYHQRFYRTGQLELLLAGPQDAPVLQRLAEQADRQLLAGPFVHRSAPPLLARQAGWLRMQLSETQPRLHLAFMLDGLPEQADTALDYLACWLGSEAPGSLAARLREAGLCRSVRLRLPHRYTGQCVAVVELRLTASGLDARALMVEAVCDWLRLFTGASCWPACSEAYALIVQRQLQRAEPLALLRHWVEPLAWGQDSDAATLQRALQALGECLAAARPLVLTVDRSDCPPIKTGGFALRLAEEPAARAEPCDWHWQCPTINPWLKPGPAGYPASRRRPAVHWQPAAESDELGVVFLGWQFDEAPPAALWHSLAQAIEASSAAALEAGVQLRFEDLGDAWQLVLEGVADVIPAILADLANLFEAPAAAAFVEGQRRAAQAAALQGDDMLIRQLLRWLPRLLGEQAPEAASRLTVDAHGLQQCWGAARWQALAVGLAPGREGPLVDALDRVPGAPLSQPHAAVGRRFGRHWYTLGLPGTNVAQADTGWLLFCPLSDRSASGEAAWRVLARLMESAFFRRLRSELQLGYAVFSRFHCVGAHAGVLFAVQSPSASATQILDHCLQFLDGFAEALAAHPDAALVQAAQAASDRQLAALADPRMQAEQAWQCRLAGLPPEHPQVVAAAMATLTGRDLVGALQAIRAGHGGWVVVATQSAPEAGWA